MKSLVLVSALALNLAAATGFLHAFGHSWTVPEPGDWKVASESGDEIVHLVTARGPVPGPRRPIQFALSDLPPMRDATVEMDARPLKRSLIIVYNYRDDAHFDYAHLSTDTGVKQPVHNGIFHVFGGERVRISSQAGPAAFPESNRWYHVKLVANGTTGSVEVTVDGKSVPALHAVDLSISDGKVGFGSFDEIADFKNVKVSAGGSSLSSRLRFQLLQDAADQFLGVD